MGDRDKLRDRDRDRDRKRDRDDRDRDRERDRKDRERTKRSHTPDRTVRSRTRSPDRHRRRSSHHQHNRTPSPESQPRKHGDEDRAAAAVVPDFVDGIVKEQQKDAPEGDEEMDEAEAEMMKMMGIPVGFDSTKGKPVAGNDVSGFRAVTKRQPRQYMNRRGGFNRPLPAECNR